MSEVEANTKPVEAVEPETVAETSNVAAAQPTEEKPAEKVEDVKESKDEASASEPLKTTAQIDYKDQKSNNKFDPTTREVTDDPVAIRKQVRFLFLLFFFSLRLLQV